MPAPHCFSFLNAKETPQVTGRPMLTECISSGVVDTACYKISMKDSV